MKIKCLNDGFVQLIDSMGSDQSICNAARVSYGNHETYSEKLRNKAAKIIGVEVNKIILVDTERNKPDIHVEVDPGNYHTIPQEEWIAEELENTSKDVGLIRYLMRHRHTTPFEMVSFVFLVRCPMHVARQWMRHRTWSYNEYSTRYKEAIDSFETTGPDAWRLQATDNKQGSDGVIENTLGRSLSSNESELQHRITNEYRYRIESGVSREQARKDLPLSTYTEFYAKVDLHNLFHFLSLRMDSHAQLEIRTYANAISEIIKPIIPASYQAFEDYRLNSSSFSAQEMEIIKRSISFYKDQLEGTDKELSKPSTCSDREWKEFLEKVK